MFCAFCGAELPDGSRFCRYCGAKLAEASERSEGEVPQRLISTFRKPLHDHSEAAAKVPAPAPVEKPAVSESTMRLPVLTPDAEAPAPAPVYPAPVLPEEPMPYDPYAYPMPDYADSYEDDAERDAAEFYAKHPQYQLMGAWSYFGLELLFSIPVIGMIFLIIFTFKKGNLNRRSFARSFWIPTVLLLGLEVVLLLFLLGEI